MSVIEFDDPSLPQFSDLEHQEQLDLAAWVLLLGDVRDIGPRELRNLDLPPHRYLRALSQLCLEAGIRTPNRHRASNTVSVELSGHLRQKLRPGSRRPRPRKLAMA